MKKPDVSVLMATWNRASIIGEAIQSVVNQTLQSWELIIVDDGSTDATPEVIREWQKKDKRITYLRLEHVGHIATVSNAGLQKAQGELVAILDDDDCWRDTQKLEKQVAFLREHPEYVACGGGIILINEAGKETGKALKPETDTAIRNVALVSNPMVNSATLFRRALGEAYDESLLQLADWDFWLRLGKKGKLYNFQEYFLSYRVWHRSRSFLHQREHARASLQIIRTHRNAYPNFWKAMLITYLYVCYSYLPTFVRTRLNGMLSWLKKKIFSK